MVSSKQEAKAKVWVYTETLLRVKVNKRGGGCEGDFMGNFSIFSKFKYTQIYNWQIIPYKKHIVASEC